MRGLTSGLQSFRRGQHRSIETWEVVSALGVVGFGLFGTVLYQGQKKVVQRLVCSSIDAIGTNTKHTTIENWALLRRCLVKKDYATQFFADAGGVDLVISALKDAHDGGGTADQVKNLQGALSTVPYYCLNASPEALRQFVGEGGLDRLTPMLYVDFLQPTDKLHALQGISQLHKKRINAAASHLLPGAVAILQSNPTEKDFGSVLDIIRETAQQDSDQAAKMTALGGVDALLELLEKTTDSDLRAKTGDTLGMLSSNNVECKRTIEASGLSGVVESLCTWKY